METTNDVTRITVPLKCTYEQFIKILESTVPKISPEDFEDLPDNASKARAHLESLAGDGNLFIFNIRYHGDLLMLKGAQAKAVQYEIGNPLIALELTSLDIRAALYPPLRFLVYEDRHQHATAAYDLPSTIFAQFENERINKIGQLLDTKLEQLIQETDRL